MGRRNGYNRLVPILPLVGHESLRARLSDMVARDALPNSLLLQGPPGVGKQRLALWLGSMLLCTSDPPARPCGSCRSCRYAGELTHPDLHWFFPRPRLKDSDASVEDVREDYGEAIADRVKAGGLYPPPSGNDGIFVATVRAIVQSAGMSPALGQRKVFVLGDAERMVPQEGSEQAANALLKVLEEPPANTTLVVTSSEPGALLPTVRSRVVAFRVGLLAQAAVRKFVEFPAVAKRLDAEGAPAAPEERVRAAAGAPGTLLAGAAWAEALRSASNLLNAAARGDRVELIRTAFAQGGSRARGGFSETLEALTLLLHDRVRAAAMAADEERAVGAARAIEAVERAKELARGNVSPQLLSASLLHEMSSLRL